MVRTTRDVIGKADGGIELSLREFMIRNRTTNDAFRSEYTLMEATLN